MFKSYKQLDNNYGFIDFLKHKNILILKSVETINTSQHNRFYLEAPSEVVEEFGYLKGYYFILEYVASYGLKELNPFNFSKSKEIKKPYYHYFKVVDFTRNFNKIRRKSKLKGFERVLDDNEYYDRIPLINEIERYENSILVNDTVKVLFKKGNDWHNFKITHKIVSRETKEVKKRVLLDD